jgi:hypothetical protein
VEEKKEESYFAAIFDNVTRGSSQKKAPPSFAKNAKEGRGTLGGLAES